MKLITRLFLFVAEEILDDGVGLLLESSGDSLDDDSEIFSEFECRKVRARVYLFVNSGWVQLPGNIWQHIFHILCWHLCLFPALVLALDNIPLSSALLWKEHLRTVCFATVWGTICYWLASSCVAKRSSVYVVNIFHVKSVIFNISLHPFSWYTADVASDIKPGGLINIHLQCWMKYILCFRDSRQVFGLNATAKWWMCLWLSSSSNCLIMCDDLDRVINGGVSI